MNGGERKWLAHVDEASYRTLVAPLEKHHKRNGSRNPLLAELEGHRNAMDWVRSLEVLSVVLNEPSAAPPDALCWRSFFATQTAATTSWQLALQLIPVMMSRCDFSRLAYVTAEDTLNAIVRAHPHRTDLYYACLASGVRTDAFAQPATTEALVCNAMARRGGGSAWRWALYFVRTGGMAPSSSLCFRTVASLLGRVPISWHVATAIAARSRRYFRVPTNEFLSRFLTSQITSWQHRETSRLSQGVLENNVTQTITAVGRENNNRDELIRSVLESLGSSGQWAAMCRMLHSMMTGTTDLNIPTASSGIFDVSVLRDTMLALASSSPSSSSWCDALRVVQAHCGGRTDNLDKINREILQNVTFTRAFVRLLSGVRCLPLGTEHSFVSSILKANANNTFPSMTLLTQSLLRCAAPHKSGTVRVSPDDRIVDESSMQKFIHQRCRRGGHLLVVDLSGVVHGFESLFPLMSMYDVVIPFCVLSALTEMATPNSNNKNNNNTAVTGPTRWKAKTALDFLRGVANGTVQSIELPASVHFFSLTDDLYAQQAHEYCELPTPATADTLVVAWARLLADAADGAVVHVFTRSSHVRSSAQALGIATP